MIAPERLERDLTAWFGGIASTPTPDEIEDILVATARVRQRPSWTFLPLAPRPMGHTAMGGRHRVPAPRRVAILLAVLGLLLALGTAWVGSRPRLAPPFGLAANGLMAYEQGGDIFVVDPESGARQAITVGPESDHDPHWSLDGTRIAFLREAGPANHVVVATRDGTVVSVSAGAPFIDADPDSIAWSPDGRTIALGSGGPEDRSIKLIDADDGRVTTLPLPYQMLEMFWRPPDGRQFAWVRPTVQGAELALYSLDDGTSLAIPLTAGDATLRPVGWTPEGTRFVYNRDTPHPRGASTYVVDVSTGDHVVLDAAYARLSNDGTRIVGFDSEGQDDHLCVARLDDGPCDPIDSDDRPVAASTFTSIQWSPDDRWIVIRPLTGPALLLDPDGGAPDQPSWIEEGAGSWQRLAE
ncbi:MAG TPA: hypothetical protein VD763_00590 [Candidatus Saccharimonadales bacterium]|nr:hypothetical protein [Candidatus Saccharimonadales bacterium]